MNRGTASRPVSARAAELHSSSVVADAHNDLLMSVVCRPPDQWASFFRTRWLPQLVAGGVRLQVLPVFVADGYQEESALRRTLRMIECAHRIAEGNAETVALCTDGPAITHALQSGRIALVLALESAPGVGADVELFATLHRLGVRIASIAHFGRTMLADGSCEDAAGSRLTARGVEAVAELERLGVVFDVSHLGRAGVDHVLEIAQRPVMATHSASRALLDHHRNLDDDQLRAIASTGGMVCVNFYAPYLHASEAGVGVLVDHILHITDVVGADRVGLGPDFVKEVLTETTPPCCEPAGDAARRYLDGLEGPDGLPLVTEALLSRAVPEEEIVAVLGANLHRFLVERLTVPGSG